MNNILILFLILLLSACGSMEGMNEKLSTLYSSCIEPQYCTFNNEDGIAQYFLVDSVILSNHSGNFTSVSNATALVNIRSDSNVFVGELLIFESKIDESYSVNFKFYDFFCSVSNLDEHYVSEVLKNDTLVEGYWTFKTDRPSKEWEENSIVELIWTEKYGLTEYRLSNGSHFKLKKSGAPPQE